MNNRGSALIACLVIAMLLLAVGVTFTEWSRVSTTARVHTMSSRTALSYADDGVTDAKAKLKKPDLNNFLPVGDTTNYFMVVPTGRIAIEISRPNANYFHIVSTGYHYLPKGSFTDPLNNRRAQRAAINAKCQVTNVGQYLIALPTSLTVDYGTNAPDGMIYARRLAFNSCGGVCTTPTQIGSAYYHETPLAPYDPTNYDPADVQFDDPPAPVQLAYPIDFVSLDPGIRSFYQMLATQPSPPSFSGIVGEPAPAYVYFHPGDLDIGLAAPLTVQGVYIIYATGKVIIHNNILQADANSWVGILSESDIVIANDAPSTLSLNAFFLSNGGFIGEPLPGNLNRPGPTNLTIRGGIVSMSRIAITPVWGNGTRTYTYHTSTDPNFVLPNFSNTLEYKIVGGKYQ